MFAIFVLLSVSAQPSAPLVWKDLPPELARLAAENGTGEAQFPGWMVRHREELRRRIAAGTAEHITYYLLQTRELPGEPLVPLQEARAYLSSLPLPQRRAFLAGDTVAHPLPEATRNRISAFEETAPTSLRGRTLRSMAEKESISTPAAVRATFLFLLQQERGADPDTLYQNRGLSADPYLPGQRALDAGIDWLRESGVPKARTVLLAGPGAEFGSRFGLRDEWPVASPQAQALAARMGPETKLDCADVRSEVLAVLPAGTCRTLQADVVADRLPTAQYDLIVATNLLVYFDETALAFALANFRQALRPGGCLLHNDVRFAVRLFGDAAGLATRHFGTVELGERGGRQQRDRVVLQCLGGSFSEKQR